MTDYQWYKDRMEQNKKDPEFLNEMINCLKGEQKPMEKRIEELETFIKKFTEYCENIMSSDGYDYADLSKEHPAIELYNDARELMR